MFINLLCNKLKISILKFKALELAEKMMDKIVSQNRRSLDVIASKCFFYYTRVHELTGKLDQIRLYIYILYNKIFLIK